MLEHFHLQEITDEDPPIRRRDRVRPFIGLAGLLPYVDQAQMKKVQQMQILRPDDSKL
jgi:hypothetical protein